MRELPILFNGEMVRAILDRRKTQTRRPIKPQPAYVCGHDNEEAWTPNEKRLIVSPYAVGDLLYVRETWKQLPDGRIGYRASPDETCQDGPFILLGPWRPSIHMPKWAARIWLEVTGVRVERVQDITLGNIAAEGWPDAPAERTTWLPAIPEIKAQGFGWWIDVWDATYAKRGFEWDTDPWVFVTEFREVRR